MSTVNNVRHPPQLEPKLAEALQVAREYFGPDAAQWPDEEVVHRLVVTVLDLRRQLSELEPHEPTSPPAQSRYSQI